MARILIADDEAQVRAGLRLLLTRAGYEVDEASNGKEAIRIHRQNPADLIITDVVMPDMDGLEVIIQLVAECSETKIIAMSGGGRISHNSYLQQCKLLGAVQAFSKPISNDKLLAAIREELGEE